MRPIGNFREHVAEVLKVGVQRTISRDVLESSSVQPEVAVQWIADDLSVTLRCYLAAMPTEKHQTDWQDVPADWWQHLKHRWFPVWALDRWPLRMRTIVTTEETHYRVCPHVMINPRDRHLRWLAYGEEDES